MGNSVSVKLEGEILNFLKKNTNFAVEEIRQLYANFIRKETYDTFIQCFECTELFKMLKSGFFYTYDAFLLNNCY